MVVSVFHPILWFKHDGGHVKPALPPAHKLCRAGERLSGVTDLDMHDYLYKKIDG